MNREIKRARHHAEVASFYDRRAENPEDLNVRLAGAGRPAHHHVGIVQIDDPVPDEDAAALAWLYRSEEALCDLVWHVIQGMSQRCPQRLLDLGCGEGGTATRFYELSCDPSLEIAGITLSEKQCQMATRNCPQGHFIVGDMLSESVLQGQCFDVAYAIESTEYLGTKGLRTFMALATRWLAPRGMLVVVAGSRSALLVPDDPVVQLFDSHYCTQLACTEDYRSFARMAGFSLAAEIDLGPVTLPYWRARHDHPVLHNSEDGGIEGLVLKALEQGLGEYWLRAWYRWH